MLESRDFPGARAKRDCSLRSRKTALTFLVGALIFAIGCTESLPVDAPTPTPSPTVTVVSVDPAPTAAELQDPPTPTPTPETAPEATPTLTLNETQRTAIAQGTVLSGRETPVAIPTRIVATPDSTRGAATKETPTAVGVRVTATPTALRVIFPTIPRRPSPTPLRRTTPTPTATSRPIFTPPPIGKGDTSVRGGITGGGGWTASGNVPINQAVEPVGGVTSSGDVTVYSGQQAIQKAAGGKTSK